MADDPGLEFWALQYEQTVVIDDLKQLINRQPDRFTGLTAAGSSRVVVYLADPTAADQDEVQTLLDTARRKGIEVTLTAGARPLRMLTQIMAAIGSGEVFGNLGIRPVSCGIDIATATVQVTVAAHALAQARQTVAHPRFAGAVQVTAVDRAAFTRLPTHHGSREGWPVPHVRPESMIGQPVSEVADRFRADGFTVEIVDPDLHAGVTLDLRPSRIQFLVHDGIIVDATQG